MEKENIYPCGQAGWLTATPFEKRRSFKEVFSRFIRVLPFVKAHTGYMSLPFYKAEIGREVTEEFLTIGGTALASQRTPYIKA
ncbi:MAG: hypothetical protein JSW39_12180 [Desulfobacterales bacterium]|nr:MAG: hypothetical protein JSW39_12180 [Desulfobacterales bacterium]